MTSLANHCKIYLEIGAGVGSTLLAVAENKDIELNVIDHWEEDTIPHRKDIKVESHSYEEFKRNTEHLNVNVFYNDMLSVDPSMIQDVDFLFYDASHDFESTRDAIIHFKDSLAETAIVIFDDANWAGVVGGAQEGIRQAGLEIVYEKIMLNEVENSTMWWNGLYITVLKKTNKIYTHFLS